METDIASSIQEEFNYNNENVEQIKNRLYTLKVEDKILADETDELLVNEYFVIMHLKYIYKFNSGIENTAWERVWPNYTGNSINEEKIAKFEWLKVTFLIRNEYNS